MTLPEDWAQRVWRLVQLIPEGKVATYGQIAQLLGFPRHSRHVGKALNLAPSELEVPWQRVINGQGKISMEHGSEGWYVQKALLESEGLVFSESGKLPLNQVLWRPNETI